MDIEGTGAADLARALKELGVRRVFGLCADQTNSIFCALDLAGIDIIGTRHESAAVHMAEGWARATAEPGVAVIGGGPGFVNGVTGIAVAQYAAVPVIVIAGQPPLSTRDRNGHQILYQADIVRSLTKWSQEIVHPNIVGEFIARGFRYATSGKPGPVCLSFPTTVMEGKTSHADSPYRVHALESSKTDAGAISSTAVSAAARILNEAERPVIIVGAAARAGIDGTVLARLVTQMGIPAFTFEVARGLIPDDGEHCFGYAHPQYNKSFHEIKAADVVLLIGAEIGLHLSEKHNVLASDVRIIQVHQDAGQIGVCKGSDAVVIGPLAPAVEALAQAHESSARKRQSAWLAYMRGKYERHRGELRALLANFHKDTAAIHPLRVYGSLERHYSPRIRLSIDGGDFSHWGRSFFQAMTPGYWLDKTEMGNIGVALPVGIGAQIAAPAEQTWVCTGDGGFGFHGFELSTAVALGLPVKVIVGNDRCWGVERRLQLAHYGRTIATDLPEIRYDRVGEDLGAKGLHVEDPARLDAAVDELVACKGPAILNVAIQREAGRLRF